MWKTTYLFLFHHDILWLSNSIFVFICIGGGGLAAGIASYVKRLYPHVKIIGVETFDACAMTKSLIAKKKTDLDQVGLFADGAAVNCFTHILG